MITKTGARWMDFIANMSAENLQRLFDAGIIKSKENYVRGIRRGTENILHRIGAYPVNVSGATQNQIRAAQKRVQHKIVRALHAGDNAEVQLQISKLKNLNSSNNKIVNKLNNIEQIENVSFNPEYGISLTKNLETRPMKFGTPDSLTNAIIARHEALEGISDYWHRKNVYGNPNKYVNKARNNYYNEDLFTVKAKNDNKLHEMNKELMKNHKDSFYNPQQSLIKNDDIDKIIRWSVKRPGRIGVKVNNKIQWDDELAKHNSIGVLAEERRLVDRIPKFPGKGDGAEVVKNMRTSLMRNNGIPDEYNYMNILGGYSPHKGIENFNKVNVKRLLRNSNKGLQFLFNDIPVQYKPVHSRFSYF